MDKNDNGVNDSTDAWIRYCVGIAFAIYVIAKDFLGGIDAMIAVPAVIVSGILVGEEKAGKIVEALKR